jgi:hypothetical protein
MPKATARNGPGMQATNPVDALRVISATPAAGGTR